MRETKSLSFKSFMSPEGLSAAAVLEAQHSLVQQTDTGWWKDREGCLSHAATM